MFEDYEKQSQYMSLWILRLIAETLTDDSIYCMDNSVLPENKTIVLSI